MATKIIVENKDQFEEAEKILNQFSEGYQKYIESKTVLKLKIGVTFGACGEFVKDINGEFIRELLGYGNEFLISSFGKSVDSMIGFDYRVIIEEDRDGRTSHYEAKLMPNDFEVLPWRKVCGRYVDGSQIHSFDKGEKIIEFSEAALVNLGEIQKQIRKAAMFLVSLITSDKLELMLNSGDMKLLN